MIPLVEGQCPDAALAVGLQGNEGDPLHGAQAGDHHQVLVIVKLSGGDHGGDAFSRIQRQHVDNGSAPGGTAGLGNLVALAVVHPALVGEEQHMIVGGGNDHGLDKVLLLEVLGVDASAAPALGAVGVHGHPLDVALAGQGEGAGLLLNEILNVQLVLDLLDLGFALVTELVPDGNQLLPEQGSHLGRIRQKLLVVPDPLHKLIILILEFLPIQALQRLQTHIQNGLCLNIIQTEALHQLLLGIIIGRADDMDDLVNVVLGDEQTLQQVRPLLCLAQVVLRPPGQNFLLVGQILVNDLPQGQDPGLLLIVHQCQHDNAEAGLQSGLLKEVVQHHLGVGILFQLDDHPHTVAVGLVPQVGNAVQALVLDLLGNVLDELALVDLIGQLRNDDPHPVLAEFLEFRSGPHHHLAAAGGVGGADAAAAHDDAAGGEVRAGDVLHQIRQGGLRVIQHTDAGINDLRQIVGRDVCGHAHGDAGGAVDQQVGEAAGQHPGLFPAFIEVGIPVDSVLVDVPEHFVGKLAESGLGVTVGSGRVAVHGAEVAVAVHQHITHGEVLGQTHHGIVNGGVTMGVVFTQNVTDTGGRLLKGLVGCQAGFIHGVKDPAVNGLQTVTHVRQGTAHNDGHGIFNIGFLHFVHQVGLSNHLVGETDILGLIASVMRHKKGYLLLESPLARATA